MKRVKTREIKSGSYHIMYMSTPKYRYGKKPDETIKRVVFFKQLSGMSVIHLIRSYTNNCKFGSIAVGPTDRYRNYTRSRPSQTNTCLMIKGVYELDDVEAMLNMDVL